MSEHRTTLRVDVISDCVCPWCYVGKRRLEEAIRRVEDRLDVQVVWHPFQLNPELPPEGRPWEDYARERFGSLERIREAQGRLVEIGEEVGIPFAFEKVRKAVNTFAAHRLIAIAAGAGKQDEMVERLFAANFVEGRDIGDPETLVTIAEEAGMDRQEIARALGEGKGEAEVWKGLEGARQIGVQGVPFFIVERKLAVHGAQPAEVLVQVFERALEG